MECGKAENLSKTQISFKPRNQLPHSTIAAVNDFYLDEKISRQMPGRKDTISVKQPSGTRVKLRKHLLSYTTSDAYEIFKTEHPEIKIGLSKFKELRPANCIPTSRHDQIVCAFKYCENAEFKAGRLVGLVDSYAVIVLADNATFLLAVNRISAFRQHSAIMLKLIMGSSVGSILASKS